MPFTPTIIDGGLDLITAAQAVKPGQIIDGSNYEIARVRGLRRMDGYERFDGGQSPSSTGAYFVFVSYQGINPLGTGPASIWIGSFPGNNCVVVTDTFYAVDTGTTLTTNAHIPNVGLDTTINVANSTLFTVGGYCVVSNATATAAFFGVIEFISGQTMKVSCQTIVAGIAGQVIAFGGSTVTVADLTGITSHFGLATLYFTTSDITNPLSLYINAGHVTSASLPNGTVKNIYTTPVSAATNNDALTAGLATFNQVSSQIQQVPGQGNVNGVFWLKDVLYATRDYLSVHFTGGLNQPALGDTLYIGASFGAATFTGQVAKIDLTSGSWLDGGAGNAVGTIMFYNTTGSLSSAALNNNTAALTAIATADVSTIAPATAAGLYWAFGGRGATVQTQSWQWCDLGWNIQYKNGANDLLDMNVALTQADAILNPEKRVATAWRQATTGTAGDPAFGVHGWQAYGGTWPGTVSVAGDSKYEGWTSKINANRVDQDQVSGIAKLTGFGFTAADIPSTAAITGIDIQFSAGAIANTGLFNPATTIVDTTFELIGLASGEKKTLAQSPAYPYVVSNLGGWPPPGTLYSHYTFQTYEFGAPNEVPNIPTNMLGYTSVTPADVINPNFGVAFQVGLSPPTANMEVQFGLDFFQIRFSYLPQNNNYYFWDGKFYTASDGTTTAGSTVFSSASANFSSADIGKTITIAGAGPGGTLLTAVIATRTNNVLIGLDRVASVAVAGTAVYKVYNPIRFQTVMHYQQGGDLSAGTAHGALYFNLRSWSGVQGGFPSRMIGNNEQIRTLANDGRPPDGGAGDGSALIGLSASAANINAMDHSALLQGSPQPDGTTSPPSKYQSVQKNFYASAGLNAVYGVSGGGPAFYFDGVKTAPDGTILPGNFSRILTGLPLQFETPRHIVYHQSCIILGYYHGVAQSSNSSNTLSFNPLLFDQVAKDIGVGDNITGLASINGDTLAIWTKSQVQMVQGNFNTPGTLYTSVISPTSGGIEYTIQPMANFMYCDFRGITAIGTTNKYGDFELGHFSSKIQPWIIPRVQTSAFFEGANIGIINSVLIRNKNMVRYFFKDAAALSMTYLADNEDPQFTIQNYSGIANVPIAWDVAQAFTETGGRDRIFGASSNLPGFVCELERSNTFDSNPITAFAILAPDTAQTAYLNKIFTGINVFGQAQDFATFNLSRSADYDPVAQQTGANTITEQFGSGTDAPTGKVTPFRSLGTSGLLIEGTAINLRFDSSSNLQYPHILQAIAYTIDEGQEFTE